MDSIDTTLDTTPGEASPATNGNRNASALATGLFAALLLAAAPAAEAAPCDGQPGVTHLNYQGTKRKQEQGGFVANGAYVASGAYVGAKAEVCDSATVESGTRVYGSARIGGEAVITGSAAVYGNAVVKDNAIVRGKAKVSGNAIISGDAVVEGDAIVRGYARLTSGVVAKGIHSPKEPENERLARERKAAADAAADKSARDAKAAAQAEADARKRLETMTRDVASILGSRAFNVRRKRKNASGDRWDEITQATRATYKSPCVLDLKNEFLKAEWVRQRFTNGNTKTEIADSNSKKQSGIVDFANDVNWVSKPSASGEKGALMIQLRESTLEEVTRYTSFGEGRPASTHSTELVYIETGEASLHDYRRAAKLLQDLHDACRKK